MQKIVKIVTFVPVSHADAVCKAMGDAGAGKIGNYTYCSYSVKGWGRFKPETGSNPTIGNIGEIETVEEERIETICEEELVDEIAKAIRAVHPYEEVPIDVYPIYLV